MDNNMEQNNNQETQNVVQPAVNEQPFQPAEQPMTGGQYSNYKQSSQNKNPIVKILAIIGGVVVGIIVLVLIIISIVSASSSKLVCKSDEGSITIMYNSNKLTGYIASNMTYDLDAQSDIAKQIGVQEYLNQFKYWFESNTTGSCTKNEK